MNKDLKARLIKREVSSLNKHNHDGTIVTRKCFTISQDYLMLIIFILSNTFYSCSAVKLCYSKGNLCTSWYMYNMEA